MRTRFIKTDRWTEENVLKGFDIVSISNKYNRFRSQINADQTKVAIRIDTSNLAFIAKFDSYVADSNAEVDNIFGQKWFKKFTVLDASWYGYYVVIFTKDYFKADWEEALQLAKAQEQYGESEVEKDVE